MILFFYELINNIIIYYIQNINKVIEKLPITSDTQAFRNKKEELFKKLDEIENAIDTFSKKKVFVKVEDK